MTTKCPVCGKKFVILYPHLYVYRRGSGKWLKYFCSYTCIREFDRKDIKMKLTLEHKKKAVEIALDGGSPIRYLESCGAANAGASWAYIKKCLQKKQCSPGDPHGKKHGSAAGHAHDDPIYNQQDACRDQQYRPHFVSLLPQAARSVQPSSLRRSG